MYRKRQTFQTTDQIRREQATWNELTSLLKDNLCSHGKFAKPMFCE